MLLILAMCAYPITFETLWKFAAFCGVVLIITTGVVFWQKRSLKPLSGAFLMGTTLVAGIWSCILAVVTSQNYLICAGVPGATAALMHSSDENYHTLLVFEAVIGATCILTIILVVINIRIVSQRSRL